MGKVNDKYEAVIGLEVHAQLMTKTKIFASEPSSFGATPNTQVSAITLALPGTLPKLNRTVVEMAAMMGLACHSKINEVNYFERKNYFYPDLPKGFQTSQDKSPICVGGYIEVETEEGKRELALTRIHLEEDAGKNNHELDANYSLVDLNRAGTPLIEIVTEPVLRNSDEAYALVTEIRRLVRYLEICDGNMEEGSLRCDANISIRLKGEQTLGTKVEVKNMNSIRNVKRAIDKEIKRQIKAVEKGEVIVQQTRSFDPTDGSSFPLRSKEFAHDYRYFPEPDLPPIVISKERLEEIKSLMPHLPYELQKQFVETFGLSDYDAKVLTDEKDIALYFLEVTKTTANYKAAANWIMGNVKSYLNEKNIGIAELAIAPERLSELIQLVDNDQLSVKNAKTVFYEMLNKPKDSALVIAEDLNLIQDTDQNELDQWVLAAITSFPDKVSEYKKGKKGLIGFFMGEVMKLSKGKADPKLATKMLSELLQK
ncbi:MAG: Asp-tRNA(Asn)/Glu-tRNA(Gln) amidotransferase subunit GatB [Bacteroidetes bacterium]|nr:Asp-tRNA(Asn)/Glu-tRNA(Gln) amidotransferase subunit GatB [Bacteroidota bacterium]